MPAEYLPMLMQNGYATLSSVDGWLESDEANGLETQDAETSPAVCLWLDACTVSRAVEAATQIQDGSSEGRKAPERPGQREWARPEPGRAGRLVMMHALTPRRRRA